MPEKTKMSRHESRELIFKLLFAREFDRETDEKEFLRSYFEDAEEKSNQYIEDVFYGVCGKCAEIDAEIEEASVKWKISRMSTATRSALRLAVYEMTSTETPVRVVLNEAVEIIKTYDDPAASSFVNGILNKIAHNHNLLGEPIAKDGSGDSGNTAGNPEETEA